MNGKELFFGLSYISRKYIDEAETDTVSAGIPRGRYVSRFHLRKPLWVAALVALLLLLVGCAAAYVLHARAMIIGQRDSTQDVFDEYHRETVGTRSVSQQVLTFSGLQGSPGYQAAKEWFEFLQAYDPDGTVRQQAIQSDPEAQFPDTYPAYRTYSQEMEDKLEELAETYHLKLLGTPVEFVSMSGFTQALGIDRILLPDSQASILLKGGTCYPEGNFSIHMELDLPKGAGVWAYPVSAELQYFRKDCLSTEMAYVNADAEWSEWTYETASGASIRILRVGQEEAYLLCDCGDAIMTVTFLAGFAPLTDDPSFTPEWMTDGQIQQIADLIDFTIRPTLPDAAAAGSTEHPEGWEIETKSAEFDGAFGRIVFHLTAPKGTRLPNGEDGDYVYPQNDDILIPDTGTFTPNYWQTFSQDDGDGLENTTDLVYIFAAETADDPTFPENATWHGRLVDLLTENWDGPAPAPAQQSVAQGVWEPEIGHIALDTDRIDFLTEPLTITVGGAPVTLASLQLRKMGVLMTVSSGMDDAIGLNLTVVLKDGTELAPGGGDSTGNTLRLVLDAPIDLNQVASIRFLDDTELTVPCK